ncbi:OPT family small oligopeptide transporter [Mycotypha africana]|uniref:OPT family small oligopeptide transporter n=1 Tax=Mycotypha africana TaxID=64632 RepID=UPI002300806A|nr:OPT family small oligopeptide transporter [Mycotypha africana]KAI8981836.1 OPT family small oligopeptide transporter [Mycotypha africana]
MVIWIALQGKMEKKGAAKHLPENASLVNLEHRSHSEYSIYSKEHATIMELEKKTTSTYVDSVDDSSLEKYDQQIDPFEDSPIEEVRASIPPTDDPTLPTATIRSWFWGLVFSAAISFCNQFFWFRANPLVIKVIVVQLLAFPAGKLTERILPNWTVPLGRFSFSLNPGKFSIKEHALITVMANAAATQFDAIDIIVVQRLYYGQNWGFGGGILLVLTTSVLGFGFAGILRRFLVRPSTMVWPINLVNATLFHTLHKDTPKAVEDDEATKPGLRISREHFFLLAFAGSFCWYFFPGYIMPVLTSISWICWIKPNNVLVSQIGSGLHGLGIGSFTLDWSQLSAWYPSPLAIPWEVQANMFGGFVFFFYILIPIIYYTNTWESKKFPFYNTHQYNIWGGKYDRSRVLTPEQYLNEEAYENYSPIRITGIFAVCYGQGLAALGAMVTHTILYNGKDIWNRVKNARQKNDDIHAKLMDSYKEVPDWWYAVLFVIALALSFVTVICFPSDMPWWSLIIAIVLALVWLLPLGIITAITSQAPTISMITEWVFGAIRPGHPIGNMIFKTYGYITVRQALLFTQDLKLGHYMKIPPRHMFTFQIVGTIIASFVSLGTTNYLLDSIKNICTEAAYPWTCPNAGLFDASSVIWGLIGPGRFFAKESLYHGLPYFLLGGFLIPIPFYLLAKKFPNTWVAKISVAVAMLGPSPYPPAPTNVAPTWTLIGFIFNFFIKKRHNAWWKKYNYVLSAALDSGVAICAIIIFFAFQNTEIHFPSWWGNSSGSVDQCPLATANWTGVDVYA